MTQYFIKRNQRVNGPFTAAQIKFGVKSKKLTATDVIATSETGPWKPLSDYYRKKEATATPDRTTDIPPPVAPQPVATAPAVPVSPVATQGTLHFTRKTGLKGVMLKIKVFVDGQLKAKLAAKQSEEIVVDSGQHEVEIKGGGAFHGAKTTVSVTAGSISHYSIKYSAMGGLKLISQGSPSDSVSGEGVSLSDVANVVDGVSTLLDIIEDD